MSTMFVVKARESAIENFFNVAKARIQEYRAEKAASDGRHHYGETERQLVALLAQTQRDFRSSLCDSFNTAQALDKLLDLISRTNVYLSYGRGKVNISVVEMIAIWVTKMLWMFGLGEGNFTKETIGWGKVDAEGESEDKETILLPYLEALSTFRDNIRQLAIAKASPQEILTLCDKLRDQDLIPLGIGLDDQDDGKALIKFVNPKVLIRQRDERFIAVGEKAARKAAAADAERGKKRIRMEKGKTPPTEMFKPPNVPEGTYSTWDDKGLPLKDGDGADLSKARSKKVAKEWEIQRKAHEDYLVWLKEEEAANNDDF